MPSPFVPAATFLYPDEAHFAHGLLRSADVLCYLENEHMLRLAWTLNTALGGLRLMVPLSELEEVRQILAERISDDTIPAEQPRADRSGSVGLFARGRVGNAARLVLAFAILMAAPGNFGAVFYVGR